MFVIDMVVSSFLWDMVTGNLAFSTSINTFQAWYQLIGVQFMTQGD